MDVTDIDIKLGRAVEDIEHVRKGVALLKEATGAYVMFQLMDWRLFLLRRDLEEIQEQL